MKNETISEKLKQMINNIKSWLSDIGSSMGNGGKRNGRNKKRKT